MPEKLARGRDQIVGRTSVKEASRGQCRDTMEGREGDECDALRIARADRADLLRFDDDAHRELHRGVSGGEELGAGIGCMLQAEHEGEERGLGECEGDVAARQVIETTADRGRGGCALLRRLMQGGCQSVESVLCKGVQQRLLVAEMPARSGVADACITCQLPQ